MSIEFPVLLTPEQAAAEINRKAVEHGLKPTITVTEIRTAIRNGELAHVELARGKWAVSPEQVTEWIAGRTRPATTGPKGRPERQPMGVTQRSANRSRRTR
jgi:hypothetical protein